MMSEVPVSGLVALSGPLARSHAASPGTGPHRTPRLKRQMPYHTIGLQIIGSKTHLAPYVKGLSVLASKAPAVEHRYDRVIYTGICTLNVWGYNLAYSAAQGPWIMAYW